MAQDEIQWVITKVTAKRIRDEHFDENVDKVVRLQSVVRMSIARRRYRNRLNFLNENEEAALRIQVAIYTHIFTINSVTVAF